MFMTLSDGTNIYYNVAGKEVAMDPTIPTLIILHGGPGISDHTLYQPFWSKLQTVIQVVLIDMRGHGRSDGHDIPEKWTLEQWGKDVYDFCVQAQLEKPIIAGISFGGWVALSYATLYPNHPKALILCHTEAAVDINVRKRAYMSKAIMFGDNPEEIGAVVQRIYDWESGEVSRELYIKHCLPLYSKIPYSPELFKDCIRNPDVWDVFGRKQYEFNFLPKLNVINCPTLVMTGEYDPEHPPAFAEQIASKIPNSTLAIIKEAGVPAYLEKEKEVLDVLTSQMNEWCRLVPV